MTVKRFEADSMPEVLRQIREDLGERAVILETRRTKTGLLGFAGPERVHVLAAVEDAPASAPSQLNVDALRDLLAPKENSRRAVMAERLTDSGVEPPLRERVLDACGADLSDERVATEIARCIRIPAAPSSGQRRIALVGPTGVGKTTTTAKLAARYALSEKKNVAMITMDTYRIGAVEQIRIYARVMGLPLEVVESPEQMRGAIARHADKDVILIDTVGRSPSKSLQLAEIMAFLNAADVTETHLVLSAPGGLEYLYHAADQFGCVQPNRLIVTKLDEMPRWGAIASLCSKTALPVSFLTDGQEVPKNLRPADAAEIAVKTLGGGL